MERPGHIGPGPVGVACECTDGGRVWARAGSELCPPNTCAGALPPSGVRPLGGDWGPVRSEHGASTVELALNSHSPPGEDAGGRQPPTRREEGSLSDFLPALSPGSQILNLGNLSQRCCVSPSLGCPGAAAGLPPHSASSCSPQVRPHRSGQSPLETSLLRTPPPPHKHPTNTPPQGAGSTQLLSHPQL